MSRSCRLAATAVALALSTLASLAAPTAGPVPARLPGPAFPAFKDAAAVKAVCDRGLADVARRVRALERHPADARWVAAMDDLTAKIEDVSGPVIFVVNVHPDPAVRNAAEACEQRWQQFTSSLGQNRRLYEAARRVKTTDPIDRAFLKDTIENFEEAGVGLPAGPRQRAKAINDRLGELAQQFDRRVRDDTTKVPFSVEELAGVPDSVWKDRPRDAQGRVLLGLESPSADPVLDRADSPAARERMYRARFALGGPQNMAVLAEIGQLRRELAALFGQPSYADFVLRRRMARDSATARRFLDEVHAAVSARELREIDELRQAKARHLGTPLQDTRLERWDVTYYTERVRRERYTVDQNAFRAYFPPQESLAFVLTLAERLFGVRYTRVEAPAWHPEVQAYAATDVETGRPLAALYVDLYPREGKYNHAAVWGLRGSSTRTGRLSQAALVVNLDRQGLTLDELETLLHEMGHALHGNLSATRHATQAGTSVLRDFVEAPSQMLEDWVYDKKVLALFPTVCPSCQPVPDALVDKAIAARDYGKGMRTARQHLYASYDQALTAPDAPEPTARWREMESATPLGHVDGTLLPASFGHLASSGYAAGYYGYLWSLVVALDLRTAFADRLDPAVGRRYRQQVIGQGSQRPPSQLLQDFLGRETNSKAFFEDLKN